MRRAAVINTFRSLVERLIREESGAATVEYALLVALVAAAVYIAAIPYDFRVVYNLLSSSISALITSAGN
jgi:Flp pilus assembly pilin Flp